MSQAVLVPGVVRGSLDAAGLNHRPILLSIDTDVQLDGQSMQEWLIVTRDHLSVVSAGLESSVLRSVAWPSVSKFRIASGVGSGVLQAKVDEDWIDLLRFSNALAGRFTRFFDGWKGC